MDRFFTPLNEKYIGKANKDMYGVVVHANIIDTLLNKHYIDKMPKWIGHVAGLILIYLTFSYFRPIYMDYKIWYDGVSKVFALIITLVVIIIIGLIFELYDYKISIPGIYLVGIAISGDYLEIYYGLVKNMFADSYHSIRKKLLKTLKR